MASDRTEKATPRRREEARRRGQIARRPDLPAAASFLAALVMLEALGPEIAGRARALFVGMFGRAPLNEPLTVPAVHGMLADALGALAMLTLPVVAAALAAGLAGNFAQGGFTFTPSALIPRAERFNPITNLKRIFSSNGLVELLKSMLKLAGIALVCYGVFARALAETPPLVGQPAPQTLAAAAALIYSLGLRAGFVLIVLAALDYAWGWYQHEKSLRMTKQEVRDEYRQQEGDPLVKGQRRRVARNRLARQIATEVPRADVVVTNPTHFAVALRYDSRKHAAPVVVAKGADLMAKRIREIAKAHRVAIVENPPLARALYRAVEPGRAIPAEMFRAVAELLAYVYRQRQNRR
jgi:flagellar biosynthetic protein FlhB